jgi:hypothetical protein
VTVPEPLPVVVFGGDGGVDATDRVVGGGGVTTGAGAAGAGAVATGATGDETERAGGRLGFGASFSPGGAGTGVTAARLNGLVLTEPGGRGATRWRAECVRVSAPTANATTNAARASPAIASNWRGCSGPDAAVNRSPTGRRAISEPTLNACPSLLMERRVRDDTLGAAGPDAAPPSDNLAVEHGWKQGERAGYAFDSGVNRA